MERFLSSVKKKWSDQCTITWQFWGIQITVGSVNIEHVITYKQLGNVTNSRESIGNESNKITQEANGVHYELQRTFIKT